MAVKDYRDVFRGGDPADILRRSTKQMIERAVKNGLERERKADLFQYTTHPTLKVRVEQVRHNPPLWRMRTLVPLLEESGEIEVLDSDPNLLEPEMRYRARELLVQHGYFGGLPIAEQRAEAQKWVTRMIVERDGVILLKDSMRHEGERR